MSEKMYMGSNPEEDKQKEEEQYAQWMADHPETVISPEDLRKNEPEIAKFEEMITSFESTHSMAELHLIIDLTPEEAPRHPVREPARVALIPIVAKLNALREGTNISPEKYKELEKKYNHLSRAVGIINNNKVYHDRYPK